jgi:hypothetical protein
VADVTRLVIYDHFDNPLAVALDPGNGAIIVAAADTDPGRQAEFERILQTFGVQQTVIVRSFRESPLNRRVFTDAS